jgi:hypothetical protein
MRLSFTDRGLAALMDFVNGAEVKSSLGEVLDDK